MKNSLLLLVLIISLKSFSQQNDSSTVSYNFNALSTGNLNGKGGWLTNKLNTNLDAIVQNTTSIDGTNAINFTGSGPNVGVDACHSLDTIFSGIRFSDMKSTYVIGFDVLRNYWGVNVGIGTDFNNDGKIINSAVNEKALDFKVSSVTPAQEKLTLPNGTSSTYTSIASNVWTNVEISLFDLNTTGGGKITVKTKAATASSWITLVSAATLGLDTNSTTKTNPKLWDMVYIHFEGAGGYFDNFTVKRKYITLPAKIIDQEQSFAIPAFPNPTDKYIQIDVLENNSEVEFYLSDALGKMQLKEQLQLKSNFIDVSEVKSGYYFYVIRNDQGIITKGKLLIKHN
jgi:hypothetical protein